jgi:hypothetical protein
LVIGAYRTLAYSINRLCWQANQIIPLGED